MDSFTPDENIGYFYSRRVSRDDFDDDDKDHESEED